MATSSSPRWDSLGSGVGFRSSTTTAWDLRWWILIAMLTSVTVHAGLLLWMKRTKVAISTTLTAPLEKKTGIFHTDVERLTIPENVLKNTTPELPDLSQKVPESATTQVPDITALAEALKDKDIILTPSLSTPAANLKLSTPAAGTAGDLVDDTALLRSSPLDKKAAMLGNPSALDKPQRAADDQVTLNISEGSLAGADLKSDLFNTNKKGTGGNGGVDGFASLDDLVNIKGPITGDFKAMLRTDLLFDFGSAELKSEARLSLLKLAAIIQTNTGAIFRLIGHTDSIGTEEANQALSEARAAAVKQWLVETLRIDGTNILTEGAGERETLPGMNPNGTAAEQAQNRRVEIHKTKA